MTKLHYVVTIIGCGGTGGNFTKEFARYASFFRSKNKCITTILIDGDLIEKKNEERQPFLDEDVQQNKAVTLAAAIKDTFNMEEIYAYPTYINSWEQLNGIIQKHRRGNWEQVSIPIIIGCVDNHRARQCMHGLFTHTNDIFYFDSANEFSVGEVVLSAKAKGIEIAPPRAFYYPDVLTDTSPSADEQSCGVVNVSAPQHLSTNLYAANVLLASIVNLISEDSFYGGIVYFDRKRYFSRFQPYAREDAKVE